MSVRRRRSNIWQLSVSDRMTHIPGQLLQRIGQGFLGSHPVTKRPFWRKFRPSHLGFLNSALSLVGPNIRVETDEVINIPLHWSMRQQFILLANKLSIHSIHTDVLEIEKPQKRTWPDYNNWRNGRISWRSLNGKLRPPITSLKKRIMK